MTFGTEHEVRYVRMDAEEEQSLGIKGDHTDLIPGVYEGSVNEYTFVDGCFRLKLFSFVC